jgi:hypothetical protein
MKLPASVTICKVAPWDGFQIEPEFIPTEQKIEVVDRLAEAGLPRIEVISFVHPKVMPAPRCRAGHGPDPPAAGHPLPRPTRGSSCFAMRASGLAPGFTRSCDSTPLDPIPGVWGRDTHRLSLIPRVSACVEIMAYRTGRP